jgi:hypothetical protein
LVTPDTIKTSDHVFGTLCITIVSISQVTYSTKSIGYKSPTEGMM